MIPAIHSKGKENHNTGKYISIKSPIKVGTAKLAIYLRQQQADGISNDTSDEEVPHFCIWQELV